jgi:hypothetical protein
MANALHRGRYDVLLDLFGASFPAVCGGYAAIQLGPMFGFPPLQTAIGVAGTLFVTAFAVMRSVAPAERSFVIPQLQPGREMPRLAQAWADVASEFDELLLDRPLIARRSAELAELLLEDALGPPDPHSRVVQLFAPDEMRKRIDRHLANAVAEAASPTHAGDALSAALADLRHSLRRA